jgi:hypothetical protein
VERRGRGISAKRKTLAASGAKDRKHRTEDALVCLAEQGAARLQAQQCRGSFSGRRRWRFVAARRQMSTHRQIS